MLPILQGKGGSFFFVSIKKHSYLFMNMNIITCYCSKFHGFLESVKFLMLH